VFFNLLKEKSMSSKVEFEKISAEQSWSDSSKAQLFQNFIEEVGLMSSFVKYAQEVAESENAESW
jgi:hypothetical protein